MMHLVRAINQYDPTYTDKVKRVVEIINNGLSKRAQFTVADVNIYLDIDCGRYIRMLCRRGFLTSHEKPAWKKTYSLARPRKFAGDRHHSSLTTEFIRLLRFRSS